MIFHIKNTDSNVLISALLGLLAVTLGGGNAWGDTTVFLVGPDLKARQITLNSVENSTMTFFDADGLLQVEPLSDYLRWRITPRDFKAKWPAGSVAIDLSDGRRWTGQWLGTRDKGQILLLKHWLFGQVETDLEQVRRIAFDGSFDGPVSTQRDQVVLVNGDRLTGFVNAIEGDKVSFQPKGKRQTLGLEIKSIRLIHLANPAKPKVDFHVITLIDGTRVLTREFSVIGDTMSLKMGRDAGAAPVTIPLKKVSGVDVANPSRRLIDLSSLPRKTLAGGKVFGLTMPLRIEGTAIRMHAPVTIQFELPPGATRFSAEARLDVEMPAAVGLKNAGPSKAKKGQKSRICGGGSQK